MKINGLPHILCTPAKDIFSSLIRSDHSIPPERCCEGHVTTAKVPLVWLPRLSFMMRTIAFASLAAAVCSTPLTAEIGVRYIEPPEGTQNIAVLAIADEGRLIAGQMGESPMEGQAWFWTAEGGLQFIAVDVDPPRHPSHVDVPVFSRVQGASPNGRFLVGRIEAGRGHTVAFRHDRETGETRLAAPPEDLTPRPEWPTVLSRAVAVSDDGRFMVGTMRIGNRQEAVFWDWEADPESAAFWNVIPVREALAATGVFPFEVTVDPWAYGISADGSRMIGFATLSNGAGFSTQVGYTFDGARGVRFLSSGGYLHWDSELAEVGIPAPVDIWDFSADGSSVVGWTLLPYGSPEGSWQRATRWDYDTLQPQFLGVPDGWDWSYAYGVSGDGSVVSGIVGRALRDGEGAIVGYESEGMFWTEATGMQSMSEYLLSEFGYDLAGNRVGNLRVSSDGELFSGVVETAAGPKIIQLWRSPYRVLHAYPRLGEGEGLNINRSSRDGSVLGGLRVVQSTPSDHPPQGQQIPLPSYWTETRGFQEVPVDSNLDGSPFGLTTGILTGISANGRFLVGYASGNGSQIGFRYNIHSQATTVFAGQPRWLSYDGGFAVGFGGFWQDGVRAPRTPHFHDFHLSTEATAFTTALDISDFTDQLSPEDEPWFFPFSMSDNGEKIVGEILFALSAQPLSNTRYGFTWDAKRGLRVFGMEGLGVPVVRSFGEVGVSPFAISGDGSVFSGSLGMIDGSFRTHPILWDYDTLDMIEIGLLEGFDSGNAFSKTDDGRVVTGGATRRIEGEGGTTTESTSWLWTAEAGLIDLREYFLNRFGPARDANHLLGARISADGKHLYGVLEWGERRELVRISRPVGWESALDRLAGDLRQRPDGSVESDWLGKFWESYGGWVYHAEHGWLSPYSGGGDGGGLFVYDASLRRWTWTTETAYPFMYAFGELDQWVYYLPGGSPDGRSFFNLKDQIWVFYGESEETGNGAVAPDQLAVGSLLRFDGTISENGFSDEVFLTVEILSATMASVTYSEVGEGYTLGPVTLAFSYEVTGGSRAEFTYGAGASPFSGELNLQFTSNTAGTSTGSLRDEGVEIDFSGEFTIIE